MFKCTICQKLHNTRVDYCDCGNDSFEEIPDVQENPAWKISLTPKQIFSGIIFLFCVIFSFWVLFGLNFKSTGTNSERKPDKIVHQVKNIPQIDDIWDDTPPGGISVGNTNSLDLYKSKLQKALYSNLEVNEVFEEGRCVIEFNVNDRGKLSNRRLYKEKGSVIFNNNVIRMMKRTSNVSTPPSGYENMKFTADVYTKNGLIRIDLR